MEKEKESIRYNLKMSVDLHAMLSSIAKTNKRSLQAEIINRLENSIFSLQSSISNEDCIEALENKEVEEILDKPEDIGLKEIDRLVQHSQKLSKKIDDFTKRMEEASETMGRLSKENK